MDCCFQRSFITCMIHWQNILWYCKVNVHSIPLADWAFADVDEDDILLKEHVDDLFPGSCQNIIFNNFNLTFYLFSQSPITTLHLWIHETGDAETAQSLSSGDCNSWEAQDVSVDDTTQLVSATFVQVFSSNRTYNPTAIHFLKTDNLL